jgi:hypothetical protein
LKLNKGDVAWVNWVIDSSHNIEPTTDVISINNPSVPLILNGRYFSTPWIGAFWPVNYDAIAVQCTVHNLPRKFALYVEGALDKTDLSELNIALKPCSVEFPRDFKFVMDANFPGSSHVTTLFKS